MSAPGYISAEFIDIHTDYPELIEELRKGFAKQDIVVPQRHHHDFPNTAMGSDTTMLLMPAWQDGADGGVKVVTVSPENSQLGLPAIQGSYLYMNAKTGVLKAIVEAKKMTTKRTAAASALASSLLSRKDSNSLLMIGTGALSTELIKAHTSVRPIEQVYIWGRNREKAEQVCKRLSGQRYSCTVVTEIQSVIAEVDIVSAATMSKEPLIHGANLRTGQHIDLVGSYKPEMREADDETVLKATLFCDVKEMAIKESGDLYIPLSTGVISLDHIKSDLFDLCTNSHGRQSTDEITLFKSVGHALEDLIAARYYYQQFNPAS